jgi:hypothetical protein
MARAVREVKPPKFLIYNLATPAKKIAKKYYGVSSSDSHSHEGKSANHDYLTGEGGEPLTNREVIQQISDRMQEIDPLVLLRKIEDLVDTYTGEGNVQGVLIPDVSTRTQYDYIRSRKDGLIVQVSRDSAERAARQNDNHHHTKTFFERAEPDFTIENEGRLESFKLTVKRLFFRVLDDLFPGVEKNPSIEL